MRHVSVFSGIGGFDLAFKKAGHELILMCENDPGCQQVLKQRFPGVPLCPDITSLQELPEDTEILSSGFPCIDLSRAGLRAGIQAGQSSGLVRHVFRLLETAIRRNRPVQWVVFENVEGVLDTPANGGEGAEAEDEEAAITYLTDALEALGYETWAYRVVASACTGLANRRKRLFIVASWNADARNVLLSQGPLKCQGSCKQPGDTAAGCFECHEPGEDEDVNIAMDLSNARSPPAVELVPTFTTGNRRICLLLATGEMGKLRIEDAERLQAGARTRERERKRLVFMQGFPEGWTEPIYPVISGHSTSQGASEKSGDAAAGARYQSIANAVTVPVAEWIGRRLERPQSHRFLGNPSDVPLSKPARQTKEKVDASNPDGDPGPWEPEKNSLLLGPTTHQRNVSRQAQRVLWDQADRGVCAALERELQAQEQAVEEALKQEDEQQAGPSSARNACATAEGSNGPSDFSGAGPSHGGMGCIAAAAEAEAADGEDAAAGVGVAGRKEARKCAADTCARITATSEAGQKVAKRNDDGGGDGTPAGRSMRSGWPRAGWWVRGGLRFAAACSDAPLKMKLQPLHEFIHTLGPMPPLAHLHTYVSRMKEQGWNVWRIVKKALETGHLQADLCAMLQMPDQNSTSKESIGWLVWAPFLPEHPALLWPSEAMDPLHPPKGRHVPPEAMKGLSKEDQDTLNHAIQQKSRDAAAYGTNASIDDIEQQQLQDAIAGTSNNLPDASLSDAQADEAAKGTNGAAKGKGRKGNAGVRRVQPLRAANPPKVLVNLFGTHKLLWMDRSQLLDFDEHREEEGAKAEHLKAVGKLPHARLHAKALDIADDYLRVQKGVKGAAGEAAKAQTAADAAAAINNMPRCRKCEACINNMTSSTRRRCLRVRAFAAAAGGHTGAQVAAMEGTAKGARLEVWWAPEERWYVGTVTAYHELNVRHTVTYDDGDIEIIPLWAPTQMIKLLNCRQQFAAECNRLAEKQTATAQADAQHTEALLNEARMAPAAAPSKPETALERSRREQIEKNHEMLEQYFPRQPPAAMPVATPAATEPHATAKPAAAKPSAAKPVAPKTKSAPAAKQSVKKQTTAQADAQHTEALLNEARMAPAAAPSKPETALERQRREQIEKDHEMLEQYFPRQPPAAMPVATPAATEPHATAKPAAAKPSAAKPVAPKTKSAPAAKKSVKKQTTGSKQAAQKAPEQQPSSAVPQTVSRLASALQLQSVNTTQPDLKDIQKMMRKVNQLHARLPSDAEWLDTSIKMLTEGLSVEEVCKQMPPCWSENDQKTVKKALQIVASGSAEARSSGTAPGSSQGNPARSSVRAPVSDDELQLLKPVSTPVSPHAARATPQLPEQPQHFLVTAPAAGSPAALQHNALPCVPGPIDPSSHPSRSHPTTSGPRSTGGVARQGIPLFTPHPAMPKGSTFMTMIFQDEHSNRRRPGSATAVSHSTSSAHTVRQPILPAQKAAYNTPAAIAPPALRATVSPMVANANVQLSPTPPLMPQQSPYNEHAATAGATAAAGVARLRQQTPNPRPRNPPIPPSYWGLPPHLTGLVPEHAPLPTTAGQTGQVWAGQVTKVGMDFSPNDLMLPTTDGNKRKRPESTTGSTAGAAASKASKKKRG